MAFIISETMNPSISIATVLTLIAFVTADWQPEPYRINLGVQSYTRLIDEISIVSPAKPYRPVRVSLDYPGGVSRIYNLIDENSNFHHCIVLVFEAITKQETKADT